MKDILEIMPLLHATESPYDFPEEEGVVPSIIYPHKLGIGGSIMIFMDWNKKMLQSIKSEPPLRFDYYLDELIEQFGIPEAIRGWVKKDGDCKEWRPKGNGPYGDNVDLLYPTQGLLFTIRREATSNGLLCPEMTVVSFCYYPPMTINAALDNNHLATLCGEPQLENLQEESLLAWPGFSVSQ